MLELNRLDIPYLWLKNAEHVIRTKHIRFILQVFLKLLQFGQRVDLKANRGIFPPLALLGSNISPVKIVEIINSFIIAHTVYSFGVQFTQIENLHISDLVFALLRGIRPPLNLQSQKIVFGSRLTQSKSDSDRDERHCSHCSRCCC